jgi:DNA-binding NarL/FixJ family response regulator
LYIKAKIWLVLLVLPASNMPRRASRSKQGVQTLRVLFLDDSAADAEMVMRELERAGLNPLVERVDSQDAFTRALREFAPDVVLSDQSLEEFNAAAALGLMRAGCPTVPLILVTGALDAQRAVASLKAGVEDIVLKGSLDRLPQAIAAALAVRRLLHKLSARQLEVLRLVSEGRATRDIARQLGISVKTVETHRSQVMSRLGIHDVPGLVRYAVRVGLVR